MKESKCPEGLTSSGIEWVCNNPREHTLALNMRMVPTWQGPRN
jgi:hypothetical protein